MENQFKKLSNLLFQLNNHITIINNIIYEMNVIFNENKTNNININLRNSINTLNELSKKMNKNVFSQKYLNISLNSSDKEEQTILNNSNNKITICFKSFDKERFFVYDPNIPIKKILRNYLEETGSLKMPRKPIFIIKGNSLNPNDNRKIGDITNNDYIEINVDYF